MRLKVERLQLSSPPLPSPPSAKTIRRFSFVQELQQQNLTATMAKNGNSHTSSMRRPRGHPRYAIQRLRRRLGLGHGLGLRVDMYGMVPLAGLRCILSLSPLCWDLAAWPDFLFGQDAGHVCRCVIITPARARASDRPRMGRPHFSVLVLARIRGTNNGLHHNCGPVHTRL